MKKENGHGKRWFGSTNISPHNIDGSITIPEKANTRMNITDLDMDER